MDGSRHNFLTATDEQILADHLNGDPTAFAELVHRYQRELFTFLNRFLGDAASADDVFQETFIQVHQSGDSFDATKRFRPWLFTIAANKARDQLRSRARRRTSPLQATMDPTNDEGRQFVDLIESMEIGPEVRLEQAETAERVQAAIKLLPENLREILLLAYFHQFPYRQIAEMLNLPLGTVKSRLHAAVEAFSQIWKSSNRSALAS